MMEQTKRTEQGTPTLSWCIIARNCEDTIEATLKSLRERTPQAEIVIVDTCSSDSTPEIAKRFADVWEEYRGPRGDWSKDMPFFDDAAAARQRSFELASGRWRGWIDTDDRLPGPEETEALLKLNGRWKPEMGQRETIDTVGEPQSLESMLERVDREFSDQVTCIYAPYLYQRDEHNRALVWQSRERIVKWSDNWRWMEKSHEVLCPVDAVFGRRLDFSGLLFLHEKVHDEKAYAYALERHFKVLHDDYQAGERTTRRCLYLAQYSKALCPEREAEFIDAAHTASTTRLDRYRSKLSEAEYYIERGLYMDSVESLGAATELMPHLPDAWIVGGNAASMAEDWLRAQKWFERALECQVTDDSLINPRSLEIWYRVLLAGVDEKLAALHIRDGEMEAANLLYAKAECLLDTALRSDAIGPDLDRVATAYRQVHNARKGNEIAIAAAGFAAYLVDNDETAKVLDLLKAMPHTVEDHPIVIELERWSKRLVRHLTDPDAYNEFYLTSEEAGLQVPSPDFLIKTNSESSKTWTARAYWAAEIINRDCPNGTILDLGCYDGLSALPILELCPGIKYVGVDLNEEASQRFRDRIEAAGLSDRAQVIVNTTRLSSVDFLGDLMSQRDYEAFDLAMWFEVIEHVPVVAPYVESLTSCVKPGGQLLISTPWGAFDDGMPAQTETRDERGHVRAMTPRNFVTEMHAAYGGVRVQQLYRHCMGIQNGADTLHAAVHRPPRNHSPVAFAVCAALWEWNSTTVHKGGFGASEETICYLGEHLATDRDVDVFGPVPEEEVQRGVGYWPQVQLRKITPDTKIVVSRAPSWGTEAVDQLVGFKTHKILWLQDATYRDLNPEVAEQYQKIVCVGQWQRDVMHQAHGVPMEKMAVIGNFLLPQHYVINDPPPREPHHFIYASSPDRGLINLLRLWPEVLAMYPDATLDIFYGWRGMNRLGSGVLGGESWVSRHEKTRREYDALRWQKGVQERGMVSHAEIAREFMRASAWTYPTDFTETFCSNAVKARAAGCVPVTTGLAALNETAVCDQSVVIPFDESLGSLPAEYGEQWLEGLRRAVETSDTERHLMSRDAIAQYNISVMAAKWRAILD
jgi:glycosyltransferase involved in cell wall biosynthesis/2-polyprenyl-3-methyl-5-hydroxy-6-metoxy-1,4-benzoquinol methylase